ncbi:M20/M25/M40 family metallo-hydrolase [Luteibacter sp. 9135]|uniref:M20/M25/M40 family metallo-hydrolase n=1 Tax=Luteibacter sp. 9135 TaxID=1500893 RepID=UPI00055A8CA0|nr:M20/M25/M40 family metallo-hydrolase [Luteibacter sp. 9135]
MSSGLGKARTDFVFFAAIFLFLVIAVFAWWRVQPVDIPPGAAGESGFSAVRAQDVLKDLLADQRPHPVDSAANRAVADRIAARLQQLGYQPRVVDRVSCNQKTQTCARVKNILASTEGSVDAKSVVFSAHYDSVGAGPGASDDGAGVATMLEIARLLKQRPPGRNRVIFLFDDGEEAGLLGARMIADDPELKGAAAVINAEARGTSGQSAMFETGGASGWLVDAFARSSSRPLTNSLLNTLYALLPNDTDLTVFKANGMQGLNFAFGGNVERYHTPLDNLEHIDLRSVQQQGDNLYGLAKALQGADLNRVGSARNPLYTDIMGAAVVRIPVPWALIGGIVLLVAMVIAARRLRRHTGYRLKDVMRGVAVLPVALVVGGATAYLAMYAMSLMHATTMPWHTATGANRVVLWALVALTTTGSLRLLVRGADPAGVWVGLGHAWLICLVLVAIALPGASYLFLLPGIVLVICAFAAGYLVARGGRHRLASLVLVSALGCFLVVLPLVALLEIMLGYNALYGTLGAGILIAAAVAWLAPPLCHRQLRSYRYTSVALVAAVLLAAWFSVRAPAYTADAPQPLNLIYFQGSDGGARLVAEASGRRPPHGVLEAMGPSTTLAQVFPWTSNRFYAATVSSATLPQASLDVLGAKATEKGRRITVQLHSGPSVTGLVLVVPAKAGLRSIAVDGGPSVMYRAPGSSEYHAFNCRGESCDGMQLVIDVANDAPTPVTLIRISAGLPSSLETISRQRVPLAVPRTDGDESWVLTGVQI